MGRKPLPKPDGVSIALARVIRGHLAMRADPLTQAQIADRVGVSQSLVSALLLGQRDFSVHLVTRFAVLLGERPSTLMAQAEELHEQARRAASTDDKDHTDD